MIGDDLRYPIGEYVPLPFDPNLLPGLIADIQFLPNRLEAALQNLDEAQLLTPYRPGGWTVQQVVHHVADSHMNAYIRFKLASTNSGVTVTPYDEQAWAETSDISLPVNISITLLHCLHLRWVHYLKAIPPEDWSEKSVFHPAHKKHLSLWYLLGMYAWHGQHHTAHITALRERMSW